jgi:hypothetical protein
MNNTDLAPMELPRPNMTARTAGPTDAEAEADRQYNTTHTQHAIHSYIMN